MEPLSHIAAALRMLASRGKIVKTALNAKRALVQLSAFADEINDKIELFLPYGLSARPPGGADVILLQLGGSRSHLIALFADDPALRIADLEEGEFGFRDRAGQQIVFRGDRIEITTPKKIVMTITGDLEQNVQGDVTQTVQGDASISAEGDMTVKASGDASVDGASVLLGGGSKMTALDQDSVVGGKVMSSATKVKAT
jgi:phage baseplate assembly protein V